MSAENKPQIITDSGCSLQNESSQVKELEVTSVPLDVSFYENGNWVTFDDSKITPLEFYNRMRQSEKLPQTSGAILNKLINVYDSHAKEEKSIISIHITSKHSAVYNSALQAKQEIQERYPQLFKGNKPPLVIDIIDSQKVSIGTWFLVEQAATLASQGFPINEINRITLETVPKIDLFVTLSTFDNVVKGGRLPRAVGYIGDKLQLKPFLTLTNGELNLIKHSTTRTNSHAQRELVKHVENISGEVIKLSIIHTNYLEGANTLKESLSHIYPGEIQVFEAGPSLGVHAGEKGLGIALQRA